MMAKISEEKLRQVQALIGVQPSISLDHPIIHGKSVIKRLQSHCFMTVFLQGGYTVTSNYYKITVG